MIMTTVLLITCNLGKGPLQFMVTIWKVFEDTSCLQVPSLIHDPWWIHRAGLMHCQLQKDVTKAYVHIVPVENIIIGNPSVFLSWKSHVTSCKLARVVLPWTQHIVHFPQEIHVEWLSLHSLESLTGFFSLTRHLSTMDTGRKLPSTT